MDDARVSGIHVIVVASLVIGLGVAPFAAAETAAQVSQPDTDNTLTRITVVPNGSAVWTVQVRTRLDTAESVQEYETFQERIRTNSTAYLDPFRERMQSVVVRASNATGREMQAEDFTIATSIQEVPRRWGIVTFRFSWTNFARRTDGGLVVGDVFQGGFYLAPNDTLVIRSPSGYAVDDVSPPPSERETASVTWVGREDFANERPRVSFVSSQDQAPGDGPTTPTSSPSSTTSADNEDLGMLLGGGLLIFIVGVVIYFGYRRGRRDVSQPDASPDMASIEDETSVMTDRERVRALLEDRDGRMRQADIAEALEWSASKTSRVIGSLEEEGSIEKLQLGRENLINLPDRDSE